MTNNIGTLFSLINTPYYLRMHFQH